MPHGSAAEAVASSDGGLVIEQHIAAAIVQSVVEGQVGLGEEVDVEEPGLEEEAGAAAQQQQQQPRRRSRRLAGRA